MAGKDRRHYRVSIRTRAGCISPDRIRDIFASSLKKYIDTENYLDECRKEYLSDAVCRAIRPYVNKLIDNLIELKQNDVKIRNFDILDYAKATVIFHLMKYAF